jgi:hypothetical protein
MVLFVTAQRGSLHSFEFVDHSIAGRLCASSSGAALGIAQECLEAEPLEVRTSRDCKEIPEAVSLSQNLCQDL